MLIELLSSLILVATPSPSQVDEVQCLKKTIAAEIRDTFAHSYVTSAILGSDPAVDPTAMSSFQATSRNCANAHRWSNDRRLLAMRVWLAETEADALAPVLEKQGFSPATVLKVLGSMSIEERTNLQSGADAISLRDRLRKAGLNITDFDTFRPAFFFALAVLERGQAVLAFNKR